LHPVPGFDHRSPPTAFGVRAPDRFHVDFLVPARGTEVTVRPVPELRMHAAALPHLGYLLDMPIETVVLGRESVVPLRVPRPERFVWHKLAISRLRGARSEKRSKDLAQASVLLCALAEEAPDAVTDAFRELPRALRAQARARLMGILPKLSAHERATELLRDL